MKKNLPFFLAPLFLSVLVLLPGCKKLFDYLEDHPDAAPAPAPPILYSSMTGTIG